MNKAVLISIQPKWCELIASGKKTVEVRKTKPKLETPFKVYIYCSEKEYDKVFCIDKYMHKIFLDGNAKQKVIGEFVCDDIREHRAYKWREGGFEGLNYKYNSDLSGESCISQDDLMKYGNRKPLYGWHISSLVIYDKPMELSEFKQCHKCEYYANCFEHEYSCDGVYNLTRPPQSWCYIEEIGG